MRVKRYVADTLQEAIARVKADLGRNAIILHTKQFKEGGFWGWGAQRRFEVIAAIDENPAPVIDKKEPSPALKLEKPPEAELPRVVAPRVATERYSEAMAKTVEAAGPAPVQQHEPAVKPVEIQPEPIRRFVPQSVVQPFGEAQAPPMQTPRPAIAVTPVVREAPVAYPFAGVAQATATATAVAVEPALESFRAELAEMKAMIRQVALKPVTSLKRPSPDQGPLNEVWDKLAGLGLDPTVVDDLIAEHASEFPALNATSEQVLQNCQQLLAAKLMFSEPKALRSGSKQQIYALIGPTGVGKTTTIAKLAANFSLYERKKVGLVTIDTYRIAAVEHLKTYGDIMNLPVEVVYTPKDLEQAIANLSRCDVILVDTAGRSPCNPAAMDELGKFVAKPFIETILLVISATTQYRDMVNIEQKFSRIAYTHLVFTKLDETSSMGPVISLAWNCKRPLAYLTVGQNVPDDIEVAKPDQLVAHLFKGLSHG